MTGVLPVWYFAIGYREPGKSWSRFMVTYRKNDKTDAIGASFTVSCGLDSDDVIKSREKYGSNRLSEKKRRSFFSVFLANLGDPVIKILLFALAVDIFFAFRGGNPAEAAGIALSVVLSTVISTVSEYRSESAFASLNAEMSDTLCRVRRRYRICEVHIDDIVVGDILLLRSGDVSPADCIVVSGNIRVDQSSLTGESREIEKKPSDNEDLSPSAPSSLLRSCPIVEGECEAVVRAVGDSTFIGGISEELQSDTRDSPLKVRLRHLAKQISRLGYIMAAIIVLAYLFRVFVADSGFDTNIIRLKISDTYFLLSTLLKSLTLGLTILVVAVPEGLPLMVAVVLSANSANMAKDKVLIRKPSGIEAAGSMNVLFTDKTGTLTEGKMAVSSVIFDNHEFSTADEIRRYSDTVYSEIRLISLNNSFSGNATDNALLDFFGDEKGSERIISKLPFDSRKKYSAVRLKNGKTLIKGAPDVLLSYIKTELSTSGDPIYADKKTIKNSISMHNKNGERSIILAVSDGGLELSDESELCFVCCVVLRDRIRKEARSSVLSLKKAGIHVVMITGDASDTATAIAKQCGITDPECDICIDSRELNAMSDEKVKEILPRLAVLSRALPSDKSRLVRISEECGYVTGMTGDGVNDAPALKASDIGFAMGNGTQVAKDAGDIIILDSNISSVCRAVLYGRTIFKSIRKFITLQLTMNFSAVGISVIGPFIGIESPVTVVQMLWINIIMDALGGLAFAGEPALPSYLEEAPKTRDEPILNRYMINEILFLGGFTVILCVAFLKMPFFISLFRSSPDNIVHMTGFFAMFIFSSVFNCFNARTDRLNLFSGLLRNPVFAVIMAVILTVQLFFVCVGSSILRTSPLILRELLYTMLISLSVFPAEFARKLLWRLSNCKNGY